MLGIGLMSGTSADGIDTALVSIQGKGQDLKIKLVRFATYPFSSTIRKKIFSVAHRGDGASLCRLNFELGELFAQAALKMMRAARLSPRKISFIGSHGQTMVHLGHAGTMQIAEPAVIAERTGVTTVADFRPNDIAAGGQGAPLTPYFNFLLFRHPRLNVAVQNLGGISNLTLIPRGARPEQVHGFDTGPGNMLIDGLVRHFTKGAMRYDPHGDLAAKGIICLPLLARLLHHPFIRRKPPKSAGAEQFGPDYRSEFLRQARKFRLRMEDKIATATALTAVSLAENYRRFVFPKVVPDEIVFGGGGMRNRTLMRMIGQELKGIKILTCDERGIPADAAEAVCFAVLAYQTLHGQPVNLPSVTGATHPVVLGKIILGKKARPFLR